jgi:NAD(P)-dependent dehydrogenase (short-subunit alcohol dehydrogenase family)
MDPVGSSRSHEENKRIIEKKALPRKGDTADLVDTSIFLHKNDYVNGQVIFLDGGRHLS